MNTIPFTLLSILFIASCGIESKESLKTTEEMIIKEEVLSIGGLDQFVLTTTRDTGHPVILVLHGHGMPTSLFAHEIARDAHQIMDHFTLVHWDQRGSGRSYHKGIDPATMTMERFVMDAQELVSILKGKYNQDRIYLWGISWGSMVGMKLMKQNPEDFIAYIGEGQTANVPAAHKAMHTYALESATAEGNKKAIKQLNATELPTPETPIRDILKFNKKTEKWATHYQTREYDVQDLVKVFKKAMRTSPAYKKMKHKMSLLKGMQFTQTSTFPELLSTDLSGEIDTIAVPISLFMGKHDFITQNTHTFFNQLDAEKEFILFENAGHAVSLDEPERFEKEMLRFFMKKDL